MLVVKERTIKTKFIFHELGTRARTAVLTFENLCSCDIFGNTRLKLFKQLSY